MQSAATLANYKSVDVVGLRYSSEKAKPQVALIQVKSMWVESDLNFPTGFSLKEATDKQLFSDKIVGPYVFVKVKSRLGKALIDNLTISVSST